jgi:HSP20 family protein
MAMRRWEPVFPSIGKLYDEMDRMFENFFGPVLPERRGSTPEGYRLPMIDLVEADGEYVLKAELPGVDKDHLNVEVLPDAVSLRAETSEEKETQEKSFHRHERSYRSFQRTISLPAEVKTGEVKASFKDGLLEVHLPKAQPAGSSKAVKVTLE